MLTEQQIAKDFSDFMNAPFPGNVPDWIWKKLPTAINSLPGSSVPYPTDKIIGILYQENDIPTIGNVGIAVNLLLSVTPITLGWKLDVYLEKKKDLEKLRNTINMLQINRENSLKQQSSPQKMEAVKN